MPGFPTSATTELDSAALPCITIPLSTWTVHFHMDKKVKMVKKVVLRPLLSPLFLFCIISLLIAAQFQTVAFAADHFVVIEGASTVGDLLQAELSSVDLDGRFSQISLNTHRDFRLEGADGVAVCEPLLCSVCGITDPRFAQFIRPPPVSLS